MTKAEKVFNYVRKNAVVKQMTPNGWIVLKDKDVIVDCPQFKNMSDALFDDKFNKPQQYPVEISENIKQKLAIMQKDGESYNDVIKRLMKIVSDSMDPETVWIVVGKDGLVERTFLREEDARIFAEKQGIMDYHLKMTNGAYDGVEEHTL